MLRHKLGFYLTPHGHSSHHDAEDLYHDVIAKLIELLNHPQLQTGELDIRNFRQYVTRISTNACHDYLRAKSPARSRLKRISATSSASMRISPSGKTMAKLSAGSPCGVARASPHHPHGG